MGGTVLKHLWPALSILKCILMELLSHETLLCLGRHDKSFYFIFQDSGQVHIRVKVGMSLTARFIVHVAETQKASFYSCWREGFGLRRYVKMRVIHHLHIIVSAFVDV